MIAKQDIVIVKKCASGNHWLAIKRPYDLRMSKRLLNANEVNTLRDLRNASQGNPERIIQQCYKWVGLPTPDQP